MFRASRKLADVPYPRTHWAYLVASCLWIGRLRPMSGTWASLLALPIGWALGMVHVLWLVAATLVLLKLGAYAIEHIERHTDRAQTHDASVFVVDEVVGQWLAMLPLVVLAPGWGDGLMLGLLLAFMLFRVLDVLKLPPAHWAETKMHNGWGVMLDDVVAGMQAAVCLWLLIKIGML